MWTSWTDVRQRTSSVEALVDGRLLLGVAPHAPRRLHRVQEVRWSPELHAVVVLVVLDVAARRRRAADADRAAVLLTDDALDGERPERVAAVVRVDHERVLQGQHGGVDLAVEGARAVAVRAGV